MSFCHRNGERKKIPHDFRREEEEVVGILCRLGQPVSPKSLVEHEKRIRREIANSNERRRMQSINAGFEALRALLPQREGEKLSKAAILQGAADYLSQLEQDRTRILEQCSQLHRKTLNSPHNDSDGSCSDSPLSKRRKRDLDSVDEGIGSSSPSRNENWFDDAKREIAKLRNELEQETALRMRLEEQVRNMGHRFYNTSDDGSDTTHPVNHQYQSETDNAVKYPLSVIMNAGNESGLGSPQSQSSQDMESVHDMSFREPSPELCGAEPVEDLSGKNNPMLLPCVEDIRCVSKSDVATIPNLLIAASALPSRIPIVISVATNKK